MSLSFQLGYIGAFVFGAIQLSRNTITYGMMSVFLTLVNRVQAPIMNLAHYVPKVVSILASAERIIEIQNIELEENAENHITSENVGINITDLTFGYNEETVLDNVSMSIEPGEIVAIVGRSGIGKTTLVRLVMSFMSNMKGYIEFINDLGEKERTNAGAREFIAYVPQGNTLFSGTIRENIRMGRLDATEEEMFEMLKLAAGYDFVSGLPDGLDTIIGERGCGLSEGQAQRIAIARALIRKAPILIFDEATSSLDEKTELAVLKNIQNIKPRPTCILITHRRSVLKYCDREICIDNKKIVNF
jgi:ABC-type multidrug transport system fused ATPase/permease subunit